MSLTSRLFIDLSSVITAVEMAKKQVYYAVQRGQSSGVYSSWDDAKAQVNGYKGAVYKKFSTLADAQSFVNGSGYGNNSSNSGSRSNVGSSSGYNQSYISGGHNTSYNVSKPTAKPKPTYSESQFNSFAAPSSKVDNQYSGSYNNVSRRVNGQSFNKSTTTAAKSKVKAPAYYGVNYSNGESKICNSWPECLAAVKHQRGVTYKKFDTLEQAKLFTSKGAAPALNSSERDAVEEQYLKDRSITQLQEQRSAPVQRIYMDGSYMNNKAGYGIYFGADDPRNVAEPVHAKEIDSYVAEVYATRGALKLIHDEMIKFNNKDIDIMGKYTLATDSETAIGLLDNYASTWKDSEFDNRKAGGVLKEAVKLYKEIKDFYHKNSAIFDDHEFKIEWVKGHDGIEGNEGADRLAKLGSMKS
ncbi:Ribonuclease H [Cyberlindnera fabianii]|uniref:ribonuclease H n=1 Tax=Cyberlindnera fabianii TaxID=36022 RepID=A0A1V2KYL8_CYBFA|nr:Ribonuclease H [Cyberlindnera fabianii]